jgi:hypothetical protein
MTGTCFVWLERDDDNFIVLLSEKTPRGDDLEALFDIELQRYRRRARLEAKTKLIRSAIVGSALGPALARQPAPAPGPALDPETEAEIEKLLAEIEGDDWLDDASEIAKTWEERFGVDSTPECKEEK